VKLATSASPATIFVHVTGEVAKPGVVEIPFGARVVAALEKAGGVKPGQKIENVNLARIAIDGEQIYFGANRTTRPRPANSTAAAPARLTKPGAMPPPAQPPPPPPPHPPPPPNRPHRPAPRQIQSHQPQLSHRDRPRASTWCRASARQTHH
jgi:competence protein ComEA